ncbi:sporulation protein YpjB [Paenibacillus sp. NPDC057967]|uniref:sporulation protein YpjB n=1 Tax=Paenibacillus sp. NPDC057967 TaxID=3346293 RepID=UPI0036DAC905
MKSRIIIPFIVCLCMAMGTAGVVWGGASPEGSYAFLFSSGPYHQLERMDETATALYTAAYTNNRQAAFAELQRLNKLLDNKMLRSYGSADGWSAMEHDAAAVERALSSGVKHSLWLEHTVRLRMGADALMNGKAALWHQYKALLTHDVNTLKQAWKRQAGDPVAAARATLQGLSEHAARIETAAMFAGDPIRMRELMERIAYAGRLLEGKQSTVSKTEVDQSLDAIRLVINRIFLEDKQAAAVPAIAPPGIGQPLKWALLLGTIISGVLTWTGWRKYKARPYGVKKL